MRSIGNVARVLCLVAPSILVACSSSPAANDTTAGTAEALSGSDIASLAAANIGGKACNRNTLGGSAFYSSCTGNGGQPEYWCSDFAKWVWANAGADVSGITPESGSFYTYGQRHGTLSNTPTVGAAVVFDYHGGGDADHVAIVTQVNANGTIETVSGDWDGENGTEAHFSATSRVVLNAPAYAGRVGTSPGIMGMTISGFVMPAGSSNGGGGGGAGGGGGGGVVDCTVHADHRLYCANTGGAAMYAATNAESSVVNHLRTTYSWFDCWGTGERHAGGNTTWYHTIGDDNGNAGWVPGVDLSTPDAFDGNPSAHGLAQCANAPPPPPPTASCAVQGDARLHCDNMAGAAIHTGPQNGAAVVNHLRTTNSWFDCWTTGDLHAGGNTTWYHTLGDDNGNWGYVPAVDLKTPNALDANPTAAGLAHCK